MGKIGSLLWRLTGHHPRTAAIVLAGGSGSRMQREDGVTKQRMLLCGEPVIVHTLRAFEACEVIDEIVVVSRREDIPHLQAIFKQYPFSKLTRIAVGGKTRQVSARLGLEAVCRGTKFVAIHDAVRCLITPEDIQRVVKEAYRFRAACAGTPLVDSLKKVRPTGFVEETPDRSQYWLAQTPQVFAEPLYRSAAYTGKKYGWEATDDSSLVERLGQGVRMVDCGRENLKITLPGDLKIAEAILEERRRASQEEME